MGVQHELHTQMLSMTATVDINVSRVARRTRHHVLNEPWHRFVGRGDLRNGISRTGLGGSDGSGQPNSDRSKHRPDGRKRWIVVSEHPVVDGNPHGSIMAAARGTESISG